LPRFLAEGASKDGVVDDYMFWLVATGYFFRNFLNKDNIITGDKQSVAGL